jgi:hypothetical protein
MSIPMAAEPAFSALYGPHVSIVAVWGPDCTDLPAWLSRVASAAGSSRVEVVVVTTEAELPATAAPAGPKAPIRNLRLTHVCSPPPAGVMRRAGVAAATGDVVLLTEPGDGDFEFRLASLLRQLEARWGKLSLAELPASEPAG